jgi:hypothetical protein
MALRLFQTSFAGSQFVTIAEADPSLDAETKAFVLGMCPL